MSDWFDTSLYWPVPESRPPVDLQLRVTALNLERYWHSLDAKMARRKEAKKRGYRPSRPA